MLAPKGARFGFVLLFSLAGQAWAADFSGTYTLSRGNRQAMLVVQQTGASVQFSYTRQDRAGLDRVSEFTYVGDGQPRNTSRLQGGNRSATATFSDATTLVVISSGPRFPVVETWRIEGDVLTLEIGRQGAGRLPGRTLVFQRQTAG